MEITFDPIKFTTNKTLGKKLAHFVILPATVAGYHLFIPEPSNGVVVFVEDNAEITNVPDHFHKG